ncbi:hypothetical protein Tco_1343032, partial [Tanacetum coccineum]
IIVISSDSSSDSDSISKSHRSSEEITYSSPDIVSNKAPSKSFLKFYDDLTDDDTKEFMFSNSVVKNTKLYVSSYSKAKAFGSSSLKVKGSVSSSSKFKASPKTVSVNSVVRINNCVLGLANGIIWDNIMNKTFGVKISTAISGAEEKKEERVLGLANGKT